jgi:hypothetical protein
MWGLENKESKHVCSRNVGIKLAGKIWAEGGTATDLQKSEGGFDLGSSRAPEQDVAEGKALL